MTPFAPTGSPEHAHRAAHGAALVGLAARGVLYLVLAWLGINLVVGSPSEQVDSRGALHELAQEGVGKAALVVLAVGFAGFALWHVVTAFRQAAERHDTGRALADAGRAVVYGALCAFAVSFLVAGKSTGGSEQVDQTWTARVLDWPAGQALVGAVGVAIVGVGLLLAWRALTGGPIDEPAVLDAAPRETDTVRTLGVIGCVARGGVIALVGVFLLVAAIQHDPTETVGLDGALRKLLDASYGGAIVVAVALGLAAFGLASLTRAWANRAGVRAH